ncbi:MAG: glycosyltransferase family 2 protein [Opitutae bacterium]|nr:glycosyltransferase family 2 protein [Opitutae bacterium]
MPAVSVILPTCDRAALLPRALASLLRQTCDDFEVLLIDNNRREPPLAEQPALASWLADPRVRLFSGAVATNAAQARNVGLSAARGEWVSYLDDDDAYQPDKLARQLSLARVTSAPLVLCGAAFHLPGRLRRVQCDATQWTGDDVLLRARWNTPLLFHRHPGALRFDAALGAGEDAEFAHRLLHGSGAAAVPVVPAALVDIFPQLGPRVNAAAGPQLRAAARILAVRRGEFSRGARRRFVLATLLISAKRAGAPARCAEIGWRLWRESRGADWRTSANALLFCVPGLRRWLVS